MTRYTWPDESELDPRVARLEAREAAAQLGGGVVEEKLTYGGRRVVVGIETEAPWADVLAVIGPMIEARRAK